ncbi:hypothetical protein RhiirA5_187690 [Rhizophagus irregularis]|uniref:Uncharacterized protein n=1 Tax=Rhizophagus irregularis TaxID=588596 RepID=A0A2N0PLB9_9GLOM|nr:hypothetical protein RhiirA5_187690 [Rhizophagus irregularis]
MVNSIMETSNFERLVEGLICILSSISRTLCMIQKKKKNSIYVISFFFCFLFLDYVTIQNKYFFYE